MPRDKYKASTIYAKYATAGNKVCHNFGTFKKKIIACRFVAIFVLSLNVLNTYLLTYLLTHWSRVLLEKLTGSAASQEIPRILWKPKVHYRTHKCPQCSEIVCIISLSINSKPCRCLLLEINKKNI